MTSDISKVIFLTTIATDNSRTHFFLNDFTLSILGSKWRGVFPDQVKEIDAYLKSLDIKKIVTPLRRITDFITDDLIATNSSFLGEGVARYRRLDGTLRQITNVPVKPKGNMMKYMLILMPVIIGALILFIGLDAS